MYTGLKSSGISRFWRLSHCCCKKKVSHINFVLNLKQVFFVSPSLEDIRFIISKFWKNNVVSTFIIYFVCYLSLIHSIIMLAFSSVRPRWLIFSFYYESVYLFVHVCFFMYCWIIDSFLLTPILLIILSFVNLSQNQYNVTIIGKLRPHMT